MAEISAVVTITSGSPAPCADPANDHPAPDDRIV
jgi:hypothetical protein